jgi:hypothetical protein
MVSLTIFFVSSKDMSLSYTSTPYAFTDLNCVVAGRRSSERGLSIAVVDGGLSFNVSKI